MIAPIAPKAPFRAAQTRARSASSLAIADVERVVPSADGLDLLGHRLDLFGQPLDLDDQHGLGVHREPDLRPGLDGLDAEVVHHLQGGRDDPPRR